MMSLLPQSLFRLRKPTLIQQRFINFLRSRRSLNGIVWVVGTIGVQVGTIGLLAIGESLSTQQIALAQSNITNVTATYTNVTEQSFTTAKTAVPCEPSTMGICGATSTLTFGKGVNNDLQITSVTTASGTFSFRKLSDRITVNRINNTIASGERQIIFFHAEPPVTKATSITPGIFNILSGALSTMEAALLNQAINRGSDNIFSNVGSGNAQNFNNIERLDYIVNDGITPTTNADLDDIGFVIMDRGANDSYKIAPILTLSSGLPDTFGTPKLNIISTSTTINGTSSSFFYTVMRLEVGATVSPDNLRPSDTTNQPMGGHFVSLRSLGVTIGQTIYGYSLLSPQDGPTTAANMKLVNSTNYPTTTNIANGGIDLIAGGGVFSRNPLPSKYTVSGSVFNDGSGNKLKEGTEAWVNGITLGLNAVLIDSNNKVVGIAPVSTTGLYDFGKYAPGNYTILLTTTAANLNAAPPAITLPTNWVTTGENIAGTAEATPDSQISIAVVAADLTNHNFGIEQLPTANATTRPPQTNPGGSTSVTVPIELFNTSVDPDGTVDQYRIMTFPSNATSLEIDGLVYTTTAQAGTTAFPMGGVTLLSTKLNTIKVDPIDGDVTVGIPFKAIDNAGKESASTATANIPFTNVVVAPPELILLKRITKINGGTVGKAANGISIDLTQVVPQPDLTETIRNESGDATNPLDLVGNPTGIQWPTPNYPQGSTDAGVIKTGDLIEYTIYFLSIGGRPVTNANLCDWVPKNTIFEPNTYGIGKGIQLAIGSIIHTLTNVPDSDRGEFFNPGAVLPANYPAGATSLLKCQTPVGQEGAVVVNLVKSTLPAPDNQLPNATATSTAANSYGFIRFVSKVK
jgi:uncharacterized repeat protein (TIGR01451 family)